MRKSEWFLMGVGLAAFFTGSMTYPHLPALVASHWNASGQVDGYLPRSWGAFGFPGIIAFVILLRLAIPRMDPKRESIARFRSYFDALAITLALFLYYCYLLTLLWNLGYPIDMMLLLVPAFAILFYVIGIILPHTKLNFMVGIRTPWTVSSETVWDKTHKAGGVAFKICGVVALLGIEFPTFAIWFLVLPIAVSCIGLVIYSYVLYEREKHS